MKRVCILTSKFYPIIGGGETHTFLLARGLSLRGYEVTVITNDTSTDLPANISFRIKKIKGFDDTDISLYQSIPKLYEALNEINPEIIHIHNYEAYLIFSLIADSFRNRNIILTIHNTPVFPIRVFGAFNNFHAELATAKHLLDSGTHRYVTVASMYYKKSIEQIAQTPQDIHIIPYGVDLQLFNYNSVVSIREDLNLEESDILILCPSRIIARKGIKEAVMVLSLLNDKYKLFLPASYTPKDLHYFQEIQYLIHSLNLQHRVILADRSYTPNDMQSVYKASDIVILPSYYEGFGYAAIEAMAMKKPVIGTDVVGLNEAIKHNVDGLLVPLNNNNALKSAILKISTDTHLKEKLIRAAWKKIRQNFDLEKQIDRLVLLYESEISIN